LEGSTRQQSQLGNVRAAELVRRHRSVFREVLAKLDGREIETAGDSFLVVFAAPSEAIAFALHMQAAMRRARRDASDLPAVRVGLHQGQVVVEQHALGGKAMEIYGVQVSTAARIMELAAGGQILCSRAVFDDARSILREENLGGLERVVWCNYGPYRFKGVEDSYDVCEVGEEGLAPLRAPGRSSKSWPAGQGEEELGWRPAAGVTVPGTNWVLEERLGKTDGASSSPGKYKGEFGEVWRARNPASRSYEVFKFCFKRDRVPALKREARLLRSLRKQHHPNLVEVYDVTEGDRPPYYLEMEYVEGPSLEEWLEANPPLADRLEIIAQVADALDTVHAAGIYHRDIKPSNILLTHRQDGALQAKLTDFGLGAAEDKTLLASIQVSRVDGVAGTWDYLAPELRKGRKASAQSDLYSLGITLYQLAIGDLERPLTGDWESQVPSEVLRSDIRRCVAGEASDRWRSAGELARALRSHDQRMRERQLELDRLQHQRRVRRLRVIAGLASAFAVMTLGLGGFAWHQRNAAEALRREAQLQRDIADEQRAKAVENERKATVQRDRAERLFAAGKSFADFAIFDLEEAIENLAGSTPAQRMLVGRALAYLEDLKFHAGDDARLLRSISVAYNVIGDVQGNPYHANLGDVKGAMESYRKALEIAQRLSDANLTDAQAQRDLSVSVNKIGDMRARTGDVQGALESYRKGLEIRQRLADAHPGNAQAQRDLSVGHVNVGDMLAQTGDARGSMESYSRVLVIRQRLACADPNNAAAQRELSISLNRIGYALAQTGDVHGALESYRESLEIAQRLADAEPTNAEAQRDLTVSLNKVGSMLAQTGDVQKAQESYRKALVIRQRLAGADPNNAAAQRDLSISLNNIGDMMGRTGDGNGAMESYRKALEIAQRLADADATNVEAQRDLFVSFSKTGDMLAQMGDAKGALGSYRKALEIAQRLADADPRNAQAQGDLSDSLNKVGDMRARTGDVKGALESCRKGLEIAQRLADADATNAEAQRNLAASLNKVGDLLAQTGDANGATESYGKALKIAEALVELDLHDPRAKDLLAAIQKSLATCRQSANAASKPADVSSTQRAGE
jgi:class 3 adenylate cyclase/tetratricopeptide (TPR) repeat protein